MSEELVNFIYIGPTIARLGIKSNTLVLGVEPPPQLKSLIDLKPVVKTLFVPTSKCSEARRAMGRRGTIENIAATEIILYAKEKADEERKVNIERKP